MSIISSAAADGFIKLLPQGVQFYLVHGPDEGLAYERASAIVRRVLGENPDPLLLVRLEGDAVARDPGALADEAHAVAMFGGNRAIWIDAQGRDLLPALDPLFSRPPRDCTIIVKAAQIKKGNALRTAFERMSNAASVECYSDEPKAVDPLIDGEAQAAGIAFAPDARAAFLTLFGEDRQTMRGEMAKLLLFAHGRRRIELEDVQTVSSGAAPSGLDDIIDQTLVGDMRAAAASAAQFFNDGGDGDHLINRLVARLTLLHRIRVEMDQGRPFDAAYQALAIKLPFAARRSLARQAECWMSEAMGKRFAAVRSASAKVRTETRLGRMMATRVVWGLASRSPSRKS